MIFTKITSPVGTIRSHAETGGGTNIFTRQLIKLLRTLQLHYEFSTLLIYRYTVQQWELATIFSAQKQKESMYM